MKNLEKFTNCQIDGGDTVADKNQENISSNRVWTTSEIYQYSNQNLLAECQYYFPFPSYKKFYSWFQ